jgi:hypothetical protein
MFYQLMIKYEYIYQYVHVGLMLTMVHLIIELDDYAMTQVLYCDAKLKNLVNKKYFERFQNNNKECVHSCM